MSFHSLFVFNYTYYMYYRRTAGHLVEITAHDVRETLQKRERSGGNTDDRAAKVELEKLQFPQGTHRGPHGDQAVGQGTYQDYIANLPSIYFK